MFIITLFKFIFNCRIWPQKKTKIQNDAKMGY